MDLQKIYTDSDFQNAVVPAGQILIFNGLEDGKVVTRYKDSSGNFGTIAGSGGNGSEGIDIILGQVNADGKFQGLSFNGLEASDSGNPETVENYCGWNGTLPVPDGGIKINNIGAAEYYKCTSVDTVNKTWTGYKAVLTDGVYSFEESETTGLTYGAGYSPVVGSVYSDEALVKSSLWAGSGLYGIDDQTVAYITFDNGDVDDLMGHEVSSVGGTPITGVSKGGWNFSGGYIEIQPWGDEFVFGTGDFTFEANLFPISNAKQCFMSYYDTQEFSPSFSTTGDANFFIYNRGANGRNVDTRLTLNEWHHVVFQRRSGVLTVFLDGVKKYTNSESWAQSEVGTAGQAICFGRWFGDPADYSARWQGYMDEIRISNIARYE